MSNSHKNVSRADAHPPGAVTDYVDLADQGSDPSSPAAGYHRLFAKATGMFDKQPAGTVSGPYAAGGGGGGASAAVNAAALVSALQLFR